jgi:glucose-6-phosphate isomerase
MKKVNAYNLPEEYLREKLSKMKAGQIIDRIWQKDYTVWSKEPEEIVNRLGWLTAHEIESDKLQAILQYVKEIHSDRFSNILLLGMGGSSMAPEVFQKIFSARSGYPVLSVLDTTNPDTILRIEETVPLSNTHFIVSTKSGKTVETLSLMKHYYNKVVDEVGRQQAGRQFTAITDPGSYLEKQATELDFKYTFLNDPDIGGRYSALSYFGLVPAAVIGLDLNKLLKSASTMFGNALSKIISPEDNSPAWLGAVAGTCAEQGKDKLTFIFPPEIKAFGAWLEQLIAESTGKNGRGIVPVNGEPVSPPEYYAKDRLFINFRLCENNSRRDNNVEALIEAGHPVVQLRLDNLYDLGGELYRWMFATAVAGWAIGINPYDQPNVEAAKVQARRFIDAYGKTGSLSEINANLDKGEVAVFNNFEAQSLEEAWQLFLNSLDTGGLPRSYIAIQAYLPPTPETDCSLEKLRNKLQQQYRVAVTVGYGPRFLHSTGQLHKGDAGKGLFIQLTANPQSDITIPDEAGDNNSSISFAVLIKAQALGDRQALIDSGRKIIRYHLKKDIGRGIDRLIEAL